MPWKTRKAISASFVGANAQSADPAVKEDQRGQKDQLCANPIAQITNDRNNRRLGQKVGGGHPRNRFKIGVERFLHLRQRHTDNRRIQNSHKQADGHHRRHSPTGCFCHVSDPSVGGMEDAMQDEFNDRLSRKRQRFLLSHGRKTPKLLHQAQGIEVGPLFDDLATHDVKDIGAGKRHVLPS